MTEFIAENIWKINIIFCAVCAMIILTVLKKKKLFFALVGIEIFLIYALRDISVGVDIVRYMRTFNSAAAVPSIRSLIANEISRYQGYGMLNFVIAKLGCSYQVFLSIIALFSVYMTLRCIYRYSKMPFLSLIIHFGIGIFAFQFTGLKQTIAMGFILLAYDAIQEQKPKKFIAYVLGGILFHPTAIVFLPTYYICRVKKNGIFVLVAAAVMTGIYLLRYKLGYLAIILFNEAYIGRYEINSGTSGVFFALMFVILMYILLFGKKINEVGSFEANQFSLLIIAACIQLVSSYAYIFTRLNYFYIQFVMIALPHVIIQNKKGNGIIRFKGKQWRQFIQPVAWCIIFIFFTWMYFNETSNPINKLTPYTFWGE